MSAPTIFRLPLSQVEGRLDPLYYSQTLHQLLEKSPHTKTKLGLLVDYMFTGFTAGKAEQAFAEGTIQIRPTNITNTGEFVFDRNVYVPSDLLHTQASDRLQAGEVLFNNTNSQELVGKTVLFDLQGDFFCSNHITRIKTKSAQLQPAYLCALLNTYQRLGVFYRRCVNWNNQSGINTEALRNLEIPLPSLQTQEHIVALMHKAYAQKAELEAQAKTLSDSVDAVLYQHLGIEPPAPRVDGLNDRMFRVRLSEVSDRLDAPANWQTFHLQSPRYVSQPLRHVTRINPRTDFSGIQNDDLLSFVPMECVDEVWGKITSKEARPYGENQGYTEFQEGDVLWAKITPCMQNGKSAIATDLLHGRGFGSTEFHVFRSDPERLDTRYLLAVLRLKSLRDFAIQHFGGSAGHQRVDARFFEQLTIPVPPLSMQVEIANEIESIKTQAQTLRTQAQALWEQAKQQTEALILGKTQ